MLSEIWCQKSLGLDKLWKEASSRSKEYIKERKITDRD